MDSDNSGLVIWAMGKTPFKRKPLKPQPEERELEPLYVGEWIEALAEQHEVVKATRISQPYIANMSGGRKVNPSAAYLRRIAKFLGITVDDLYISPPGAGAQISALKDLSPAARSALMRRITGESR